MTSGGAAEASHPRAGIRDAAQAPMRAASPAEEGSEAISATSRLPTTAPSAKRQVSATCSGDEMPKPTATGRSVCRRMRSTSGAALSETVARAPEAHLVPLIPQAEALAWSSGGGGLYATGEFSPAPLFYLVPQG